MKRIKLLILTALVVAISGCLATINFDPVQPLPTANPIDLPTHVNAYNLIDPFGVIVTCQNRGVAVMEQYPQRILIVCAGPTNTPGPTATTVLTPTATSTPTPAPSTVLISDTFTNATSGISLHVHPPAIAPLGGWTERFGDWKIIDNAAALAANVSFAHATIDSGQADGVISASISNNAQSAIESTSMARISGIVLRYTDINNYWLVGINSGNDWFRIIERKAGVNKVVATTTIPLAANTLYLITVTFEGDNISAMLDGGNELIYNIATHNEAATQHGIMLYQATDRVDSFMMRN